jgi:hypothetical protein
MVSIEKNDAFLYLDAFGEKQCLCLVIITKQA